MQSKLYRDRWLSGEKKLSKEVLKEVERKAINEAKRFDGKSKPF